MAPPLPVFRRNLPSRPSSPRRRAPWPHLHLRWFACLLGLGMSAVAHAGLTFSLDRPQAVSGEPIAVQGLFFNDQKNKTSWVAPELIVLQWRSPQGEIIRTTARLDGRPGTISLPVGGYARVFWKTEVPASLVGLQAISVEGYPALLALDTDPIEDSRVAATPANVPLQEVPVVQTGNLLAASPSGISVDHGPAPLESAAVHAQAQPVPSASERFLSAFSAYEPLYFAFGNRGGFHSRFQLSFRYRLFNPRSEPNLLLDNLFLGYTQTAMWDLSGESKPFIDTTYNPSLFWRAERLVQSDDARWGLGFATGAEHASNGRDGPESRSLNDFYIQPIAHLRFGSNLLTFQPRFKQYFGVEEENHDFRRYAGRVDWRLRWAQDNGIIMHLLYRQGSHSRRATQVDASWPLKRIWPDMNGYLFVQYFNGYGETLLGYNERQSSQFRVGISIVP